MKLHGGAFDVNQRLNNNNADNKQNNKATKATKEKKKNRRVSFGFDSFRSPSSNQYIWYVHGHVRLIFWSHIKDLSRYYPIMCQLEHGMASAITNTGDIGKQQLQQLQ